MPSFKYIIFIMVIDIYHFFFQINYTQRKNNDTMEYAANAEVGNPGRVH